MVTMTVRLLKRSEKTPAKAETIINGSVKITKACVVCVWDAVSNAGPDIPEVVATCLMAREGNHEFPGIVIKGPKKLGNQ